MDEEVNITELLLLLWKKKIYIIVITIIFTVVAFLKFGVIDNLKKEEEVIAETDKISYYYAQTTFLIKNPNLGDTENYYVLGTANDITDALLLTYSEMIKSEINLNNIITRLNLNIDATSLYNLISISRVSRSNLIRVDVAYENKEQALQIANELMNELKNNMSNVYATNEIVVIDNAYILSDQAIAEIFNTYIVQACGDEASLKGILSRVDIVKILPTEYLKEIFNKYVFTENKVGNSVNISIVKNIINPPVEKSDVVENTCIAGILGFVLSSGVILAIYFFRNTINNENYIDTKLLGIVDSKKNNDIFDILKIKLEQNSAIAVTSVESNDEITSIVNNLVKAFEKNNKKVLLLDPIDISKISSSKNEYDYVIVNAKNILEDANSLMAIKQIKNTVLLITEGKTKQSDYKKVKETIDYVDANLLGSILIR